MKLGKDGDAEQATVAQVISKLVIRGVKSDDILIITGRNRAASRWQSGVKAGIYSFVWYPESGGAGAISVIAATDAKAIESPVVLLTELDGLDDNPSRDVILYQALSRAQLHLVVVGDKDDIIPE
jgi:superfamily I DNA/RNA helicase